MPVSIRSNRSLTGENACYRLSGLSKCSNSAIRLSVKASVSYTEGATENASFAGVANVGVERGKVILMLSRKIPLLIHGMTNKNNTAQVVKQELSQNNDSGSSTDVDDSAHEIVAASSSKPTASANVCDSIL